MYRDKQILLNEKRIKQKLTKKKANKNNIKYKSKTKKKSKKKPVKKKKLFFKKIIIITIILFIISLLSLLSLFIYKKYIKKEMHNIPIAFSLNTKYLYPLIVSLTSILYNASPYTFYVFYLLLSPDLQDNSIQKILGLREKYPNCRMELIYMGKKFAKYHSSYYKSVTVYYRLELSNLITDVDKLIYLDADTIVHKDLTEFYNLDMGKNYYMGFPAHDLTYREFNGTRNFINSGVMLINLKKLREVNAPILLQDYYNKYGTKKVDEYLINAVFYDKVSFLPLVYGVPDFGAGETITKSPSYFLRKFNNLTNYTVEDMRYAHKNRVITHNCYELTKWWMRNYHQLTNVGKQWLFYAARSHVVDEICKYYHQFESHCDKIKNESSLNLTKLLNNI